MTRSLFSFDCPLYILGPILFGVYCNQWFVSMYYSLLFGTQFVALRESSKKTPAVLLFGDTAKQLRCRHFGAINESFEKKLIVGRDV